MKMDLPRFGSAPRPLQLSVKVAGAAPCLSDQILRDLHVSAVRGKGQMKTKKKLLYLEMPCIHPGLYIYSLS